MAHIPITDERVGVQVKPWDPLRTRAIGLPERFWDDDSWRGAISRYVPLYLYLCLYYLHLHGKSVSHCSNWSCSREAVADSNSMTPSAPNRTRNSAVADKSRDTLVQMQWRGCPPKTRPSPYMLPWRIWSFCVKGWRHKYRTPKIREPWNSAVLGWEAWLTPRYMLIPDSWIWSFQVKRYERY